MSKKLSSASDTEFREAIGKAIPNAQITAMAAGATVGYMLGKKKRVKRRKTN